ncbi:MAG: hypothetical protein IMF05_08405 [Proteobacteria bacterium]|nr:hypothetical protein [Pseudomonadota bacterium]
MIGADALGSEATPRRILRQAQDEEYMLKLKEKILILSLSKDAQLGRPPGRGPAPIHVDLEML